MNLRVEFACKGVKFPGTTFEKCTVSWKAMYHMFGVVKGAIPQVTVIRQNFSGPDPHECVVVSSIVGSDPNRTVWHSIHFLHTNKNKQNKTNVNSSLAAILSYIRCKPMVRTEMMGAA